MDRFIANKKQARETQNINLKSNMDRFIVYWGFDGIKSIKDLKSNMDRFIDVQRNKADQLDLYLKSNMDRFIVKNDL